VINVGSQGADEGDLNKPHGIVIDKSGFVYVTDGLNHRVQKLTLAGGYVAEWGSYCNIADQTECNANAPGAITNYGDGQFNEPWGIAVDNIGNVYVTDYENNRVQKFSSSGHYVSKWGSPGSGNGQFNGPRGIAVDSNDNI
jgi:DNA-binding beta-propeller fold protein YncE